MVPERQRPPSTPELTRASVIKVAEGPPRLVNDLRYRPGDVAKSHGWRRSKGSFAPEAEVHPRSALPQSSHGGQL